MRFPVMLHKDPESDYGVTVPDLPGCFSAGATLEEALDAAREAIEAHVEGMLADGEPIPGKAPMEEHQNDTAYAGGAWALVEIGITWGSWPCRE